MEAAWRCISGFGHSTRRTPTRSRSSTTTSARRAGGHMVFLRGQVGQDLETRESVGVGDAAAQTDKAMANIKMLLEEAGSELAHICKIVVYLTDVRYREPVYQAMGKWLKGVFPVSTGLIVTGLARPEWVVEIDATAVIPDERRRRGTGTRYVKPENIGGNIFLLGREMRADRAIRRRGVILESGGRGAMRARGPWGWSRLFPEHHRPAARPAPAPPRRQELRPAGPCPAGPGRAPTSNSAADGIDANGDTAFHNGSGVLGSARRRRAPMRSRPAICCGTRGSRRR